MDSQTITRVATTEQVRTTNEWLALNGNIGCRDHFNGEKQQQFIGKLAEFIVGDLLGIPRTKEAPTLEMDGGYDLEHAGRKWDVKTKIGTVNHLARTHPHNLHATQTSAMHQAEGYIFVHYNKIEGTFQICGTITKEEFLQKAKYYPAGEERPRTDGTTMTVREGGMYEIFNKHLSPIKELMETKE